MLTSYYITFGLLLILWFCSTTVAKLQDLPPPHSYLKHAVADNSQRDQSADKDLIVKVLTILISRWLRIASL